MCEWQLRAEDHREENNKKKNEYQKYMEIKKYTFPNDTTSVLHGFPDTYIMSLHDSYERHTHIHNQFKQQKVSYTLCKHGKYPDECDYKLVKHSDSYDGFLTKNPRIGNTIGTLKTIEHWLNTTDSEYAFIGEDDININVCEYWNFTWVDFMKRLGTDFDFVQMVVLNEVVEFMELSLHDKRNHDWSITGFLIHRKYATALVNSYRISETEYQFVTPYSHRDAMPEYLIYRQDEEFYKDLYNVKKAVPLFIEDHIISRTQEWSHINSFRTYDMLKNSRTNPNNLDHVFREIVRYYYLPSYEMPIDVTTKASQVATSFGGYSHLRCPKDIQFFYNLINADDKYNIVDVGAQNGSFTLLAKYVPNSNVYAFEPCKVVYDDLVDNVKLNNLLNVKTYNMALSDKEGEGVLNVSHAEQGLSTLAQNPLRFDKTHSDQDTVKLTTLDTLFYDKSIRVDFMKIDTEGWEYCVLKGGEKTVKEYKPVIFLEWNETNIAQAGVTVSQLDTFFEENGYTLYKKFYEDRCYIPTESM